VSAVPSVIRIGIDPTIEIGPITVAWHGLMIAVGIVVGGLAAAHDAQRRGLEPEPHFDKPGATSLDGPALSTAFRLYEEALRVK
jgi:hypothetical protein